MTFSEVLTRPPADREAGGVVAQALVCDAGVLAGRIGGAARCTALARARLAGLRMAFVYDRWPEVLVVRTAAARGDVIAVPGDGEVTVGRGREVRPEFVARLCDILGVVAPACVVIAGRRPLLAAAAWAGALTVMVPDDGTPLFDVRGQRLAPDLAAAIDGALVGRGRR